MKYLAAIDIGEQFGSPLGDTKGVSHIVSLLMSSALAVGGVIAIFLFIFGGLKIIMGAGNGGDPKSVAEGKQAVTYAIIGFIIIFATFWIIRVIEVIIGSNFVTAPGLDGTQVP